ncbi:YjgF-like protein [Meredithblackwellia eburnea MCA 4105]
MVTTPLKVEGVQGLPEVFSAGIKLPATANLVHCSGQIAAESGGPPIKLLEGTIGEKTEFILRGLEKVLVAGGSSLAQLVKVNIYITDFAFFAELNEAYCRIVPNPKPVRTCVCVKALPFGAEIEMEATGWAA